tara:strand:+ start:509 stop:712 length:204 start_codon:yes stop_codon:yes gene_type:complete
VFEDSELMLKVAFYSALLVGCGWYLGKGNGIKTGAGRAIDHLCENGYLRHKKKNGEIELIKLNGEIE